MTDDELEGRLRTLLRERANTITSAPAWHPAVRTRRDRRWPVIAAAAAAVVLVAGLVTLVVHAAGPDQSAGSGAGNAAATALTAAPSAIPAGTRAVSTLGVELFVPSSWTVNVLCTANVSTPLGYLLGPASCPPGFTGPRLGIDAASRSSTTCPQRVGTIAGSSVCTSASSPGTYVWTIRWVIPVTVTGSGMSLGGFERIIRTAHTYADDHDGCSSEFDVAGNATTLTANPTRVDVCAYGESGQDDYAPPLHLGSAALTGSAAASVPLDPGAALLARHGVHSPRYCGDVKVTPIEAVVQGLVIVGHYAGDRTRTVVLSSDSCIGEGFGSGAGSQSARQNAVALLEQLLLTP